MDRLELKRMIFIIVDEMLLREQQSPYNTVYIDKNGIYVLDEKGDLVEKLVETSKNMDTDYISSILASINRIKLTGDYYRTVTYENFYINMPNKPWKSTGNAIILKYNELKVLENGNILYKTLIENSNTATDFAIAVLDLNNYIAGYVDTEELTVYGTDRNNRINKLSSYDIFTHEGARLLSFEKLGKWFYKYEAEDPRMIYLLLPYKEKRSNLTNLSKALNTNGLIVVQDARVSNLVEDIIDIKKSVLSQINIIQVGSKKSTIPNYISNILFYKNPTEAFYSYISNTRNNIIIDAEAKIPIEKLIQMSETNHIIVNNYSKSIIDIFNQSFLQDPDIKTSFIQRLRYFGNPEINGNDMYISNLEKELLNECKYEIVNEVLDYKLSIKDIVKQLVLGFKNISQIYNSDSKLLVLTKSENKINQSIVKGIQISRYSLAELLYNTLNVNIEDVIDIIYSKKGYSDVFSIVDGEKVYNIRINVLKTDDNLPNIFMSISRSVESELYQPNLQDHRLNYIVGDIGSGKTRKIKANIPKNENLFIYDTDFEYSLNNSIDLQPSNLVIERELIDIITIKQINPTMIVINSTINLENLKTLIPLVTRGIKMLISLTPIDLERLEHDNEYQSILKYYNITPNITRQEVNNQ